MNAQALNRLLESRDVWIVFLLSIFVLIFMLEELLYEHTHSLCLFCILDGLLYQKIYDPLFVVVEEYLYIPLCLIGEELYDVMCEFVIYALPLLRVNDRWLYQHRILLQKLEQETCRGRKCLQEWHPTEDALQRGTAPFSNGDIPIESPTLSMQWPTSS